MAAGSRGGRHGAERTSVNQVKVGADTQAGCTSCRTMHEHLGVAMVGSLPAKVECAECHKQHLFRAGPPGTKVKPPSGGARPRKAAESARAAAAPRPVLDLAALAAGRTARGYDPRTIYAAGDVVRHPNFGVG